MISRREFLRPGSALGTAVGVLGPDALARVAAATAAGAHRSVTQAAGDER